MGGRYCIADRNGGVIQNKVHLSLSTASRRCTRQPPSADSEVEALSSSDQSRHGHRLDG